MDIILTTEPVSISKIKVLEPFGSSDHCQVEFSVFTDNVSDSGGDLNVKRYNWDKADFDGMSNYIAAVGWLELLSVNLTADQLWAAFSNVLQSAIDLFVPVKHVSEYMPTKNRRWYPAALRRAIARKRCLHRRRSRNGTALAAYHDAERQCRQMLRDYEIRREQKVIDSNNAGSFFRFVNGKLSCKSGLGALSSDSGDVITSDADRANLLNDYFASVCTADNGDNPHFERVVPPETKIETVEFSPEAVYAAIRKMKAGGSSGPDGFPPLLFKKLASELSEPLSLSFAPFMSVGQMPREWAHAIVTPIYKCGSASAPSNYRPISLTCVSCKLMERVIASNVLTYLRQHGVINKQQHGFLKGRLTSSDLLESINDWTLAINNKQSVVWWPILTLRRPSTPSPTASC